MKEKILGQYLRSCDGNMQAPLHRAAFDYVKAQAGETGGRMEVKGTAVRYGVVGWFWFGALRLEPASLEFTPGANPKYRDALGLAYHDTAKTLARVGNNTLDFTFGEESVEYAMRLNAKDPEAQAVWAKVAREDVNASSIGFIPVEGELLEDYDNSLDADPEESGMKVEMFACTKAYLVECSLVPHGAFAGATSFPSSFGMKERDKSDEASSSTFAVRGKWSKPIGVKAELDEGAITAATNADGVAELPLVVPANDAATGYEVAILANDESETETDQSASADAEPGGPGDVASGSGEVNDQSSSPDGVGGNAYTESGTGEAEAERVTLEEVLGRSPSQLKRRLENAL